MPAQADDNEEQHVLIVGETEENVNRAKYLIEKVLYSDDNTRNRIKDEQLKASQEMRTELFLSKNCLKSLILFFKNICFVYYLFFILFF
jgi:hypothetical protein